MATLRINSAATQGYLNQVVTLAGSAAKLTVYTTPMPSTGGGAVGSATQLGQVALANPIGTVAWNSGASDYQLTIAAGTADTNTAAAGTAAWLRITDGSGTYIADLDITATGGGGACTMGNTSIYQGGTLSIGSFIINLPAS